jgi:hypothetical protein
MRHCRYTHNKLSKMKFISECANMTDSVKEVKDYKKRQCDRERVQEEVVREVER